MNLIRAVTLDDLDGVLDLEEETFPTPWTRQMLTDELQGDNRRYLLMEGPDGLIGYGGVMVSEGDGHIMTIAITPERRRRGRATELMLMLIKAAIEMGADRLLLEVRPSNRPARKMYQKFGFAPVGIRPRYYRDEDAIVMWVDNAATAEYAELLDGIAS